MRTRNVPSLTFPDSRRSLSVPDLFKSNKNPKLGLEKSVQQGGKLRMCILTYGFKVGVQLRAVVRPVFNTLFLLLMVLVNI